MRLIAGGNLFDEEQTSCPSIRCDINQREDRDQLVVAVPVAGRSKYMQSCLVWKRLVRQMLRAPLHVA
jgi:hypothetical protein